MNTRWITRDNKREKKRKDKKMRKAFKNKTPRDTLLKRDKAEYKRNRKKIQELEWSDY